MILIERLITDKLNDSTILAISSLEKPLVSVIVPVYNQEQTGFLIPCISSLVNQSLKNIEIICVDDASTDHSLEILQQYAATYSNITIISMMENSRQGTARNRAIEVAKGDYISFVDSDDCLEVDFYEKMCQVAKDNDCDAVESSFQYINEQDAPIGAVSLPHGGNSIFIDLDNGSREYFILNHGMIWSYLFKSDLLKETNIRFPEKTRYEDTPFLPRILFRIQRMGFCPNAIYCYRKNSTSTMSTTPNDVKALTDRITTADMIINYAKADGYYSLFKDALDYYYLKVAVVNTLYTISKGSIKISKKRSQRLINHVENQIPTILENKYYKSLPIYQRITTFLALKSPRLYCSLRKISQLITYLK